MIDEVSELRRIKRERKLTYQELAEMLRVHQQSVINWILGNHKPSKMAKRVIRQFIVNYEE